jgi:hypothetical protein
MKDDYLWDRSGPDDAEIEDLERRLAPLRCRPRPELLGSGARHSGGVRQFPPHGANPGNTRPNLIQWAAAAAAVFVVLFAALWQVTRTPALPTGWQVAGITGSARLGDSRAVVEMPVHAGQVIRTGKGAGISLQAGELGRIDLLADSELRAGSLRRMDLRRGTLHAFIWAPPRQFSVETPSTRVVDMGCEYTLGVDEAGNGLLRVSTGWVAFQSGRGEAFIPEGAACATRKLGGPGIPFFEDAAPEWKAALASYESGNAAALGEILHGARKRDALSLWHLLTRVAGADRARVFERFAALVELPGEVSRAGVVRQEAAQIDLCWNALNLENTSWWRGWKRNW